MAKKPSKKAVEEVEDPDAISAVGDLDADAESRIDPFLAEQMAQVRRMTEGSVTGQDTALSGRGIIALPLQTFSQRYLFGNTGFLIGRMTELVGESGSCKSAFLFEIYRWHLIHGGIYKHILTEQRDSPDLRESITGVPEDGVTRNQKLDAAHIDDWQRTCMATLHAYAKTFPNAANKKSMATPLTVDGVDSLTAVTTKKASDEIWADGAASPGFSPIARAITDWSRVYFARMSPYPVSFVGVNHLKDKPNSQGLPMKTVPGGAQLQFAATTVLRFRMKKATEKQGWGVRHIEISTNKNSVSAAGDPRELTINMTWCTDPETSKQVTVWDWHSATASLLLSFDEGSTIRKKIDKIVRIEGLNKTTETASCPTLKIKKASLYEIGMAIDAEPDVSKELDDLFSVRRRHAWRPGVPYAQQVSDAERVPLYSSAEEVPETEEDKTT